MKTAVRVADEGVHLAARKQSLDVVNVKTMINDQTLSVIIHICRLQQQNNGLMLSASSLGRHPQERWSHNAAARASKPSTPAYVHVCVCVSVRDGQLLLLRALVVAFHGFDASPICTHARNDWGTGEEPTPRCMHLYLRAAVGICSLLQVHTSGHR